jgi:hypothetical protein
MVACGLSGFQPPYCLPKAHTSAATGAVALGCRGTAGRSGRRGSGCRGGSAAARRGGAAGAAAGAEGAVRRGVDAGAGGRRDGPIISRASRAGAWTIWGSALPSGWGSEDGAGPEGAPGASGRCTVTQPETAETATVTRSVAVVAVRCTRATLLCPPPFGELTSGGCPAWVNDLRPSPGGRARRPTAPSPRARLGRPGPFAPCAPRPLGNPSTRAYVSRP